MKKYKPPPNPPLLIQKFRDQTQGETTKKLVDLYYQYLGNIRSSTLSAEKRLEFAERSLPLIEPLIRETAEQYGKFDLSSIPAIEYTVRYWKKRKAGLEQLRDIESIVKFYPELQPWVKDVDVAISKISLPFQN